MTLTNKLANFGGIILLLLFFANASSILAKTNVTTSSDSILIEYLKDYGIRVNKHNNLKILKSGREKFIDLFQQIEKAKHHIREGDIFECFVMEEIKR